MALPSPGQTSQETASTASVAPWVPNGKEGNGPAAQVRLRSSRPGPVHSNQRDLIRRELCVRFGQAPQVEDGIYLRTWRGGPQAGQPRLPKVAMAGGQPSPRPTALSG